MARRRDPIPGIGIDAERAVNQSTGDLDARLRKLERKPGRPGRVIADTTAKAGEFLNIEAPAAGLTVIFPEPVPSLRDARVTLSFRNTNPVRLVCIRGEINRESFVVNTAIGTFEAICDGLDGWSVETGLTSTGSSVDAEYLLGAAHGSLPSARVATDSTEIDADLTVVNVVSWALRNASVVFSKLQDLTGLSVLGRAANSSGVMAAITATAARQTLRLNDAGTALAWGFPIEGQSAGADQGDAHTVNVASGDGVDMALAIAAGVATITPTIDVSDFAGTGLEDDGSNNLRIAAGAAGAGLTGGGGGALAVGAGTGIQVNANDVQLATISAHSFLGNATGSTAVPTGNSLATLAGDYLNYNNAGGINWAGAGILDNAGSVLGTQGQILQGLDSTTIEEAWSFSVDTAALRYNVRLDATFAWTGSHSFAGTGTSFSVDVDNTIALVSSGSTVMTFGADSSISVSGSLDILTSSDLTLDADGNVIVLGSGILQIGDGVIEGYLRMQASTTSAPSVASNEGMFWAFDPGAPVTLPYFTDDGNVDHELAYAADVDAVTSILEIRHNQAADASISETVPAGCTWFEVEGVGGGGGGGGADADSVKESAAGSGGGAGAWFRHRFTVTTGTITGAIGAAGTAGANTGGNGGTGGTTTVTYDGVSITAPGGGGGDGTSVGPNADSQFNASQGSLGGTADATATERANGGDGYPGMMFSVSANANCACGGNGGASKFGGGGRGGRINTDGGSSAGTAGVAPGSGGAGGARTSTGAASTGVAGGAGAPGMMKITFYSGTRPTEATIN
jgi:hypothetical protein